MITIKEIEKKCSDTFKIAGLEFKNIPVTINGRLTKTLGRCCYKRKTNGKTIITKLEFSRNLLETCDPSDIDEVIKHECAHAIACIETGEPQGHNAYFKQTCAKIGAKRASVSAPVKRIVPDNKIYKYFVICKNCGIVVGKYHKKSKVIKYPDYYKCGCGGELKVVQNF